MTSTADSTTSKAQSLRQSSSSPTDRQPLPPVAKVLKLSATANDNNHHHQNSNNNSDCHHNIVRGGDTNGRDNECADTVPCAGTTLPPQRPVVVVGTNRCVVEPTAGGGGVPLPRLIPRNLPMAQSRNRVQIEHNQGFKIYRLLRHDWFHVFLRLSTARSVLCLLTLWTAFILIFAALYVWVDNQHLDVSCGLGPAGSPINFGGAFAFSLQTCTTVGYTLPNGTNNFFLGCRALQVVIYFQMIWSMLYNAFLFAFVYARLARVDSRGAQVVLSSKAIVTVVEGQVRFQVRVYDIDAADPVIEAHIRMYAVTKERPVPRQLRLIQPNDELGAMLFLSVPTVVSHQIDLYSVLHPPRPTPVNSSGLILRQADAAISSREEVTCPICGEGYGTYERWRNHVRYQRILEEHDGYPIAGTHLSLNKSELMPAAPEKYTATLDIQELKGHFAKEISEVICVVEGIEPMSSGTFSSLQSYRFEDVIFQSCAHFRPCLEAVYDNSRNDSFIRVDLDRFHEIDYPDLAETPTQVGAGQRSFRAHDYFFFINNTEINQTL